MTQILYLKLTWSGNKDYDISLVYSLVDVLLKYPGEDKVLLYSQFPDGSHTAYQAKICQLLIKDLKELLGKEAVKLETLSDK
jgi:hypothetical protein